jgi:thiosulfate reductase cytochrome b subunit
MDEVHIVCVRLSLFTGCALETISMQTNISSVSLNPRASAIPASDAPVTGATAVRTASSLRHLVAVRVTHWLFAIGVLGLIASGSGILISHPRLYWGETGGVGSPSLVDLPLPMIIGPSVWNRPIHFFFAWFLVLGGLAYVIAGIATKHLRRDLLPVKTDLGWRPIVSVLWDHLRWKRTDADEAWTYNVVQRLSYLAVLFVLFPGIVWTGLAMSFGVTSVFPLLATLVGGHQSARTLHFVFASLLLIFFIAHMAMLCLVGFGAHVQAMITGHIPQGRRAE